MTDRDALKAPQPPLPLLRRLHHWLGHSNSTSRRGSIGLDSARMDLGYEAAYTPPRPDGAVTPSRFDEERPAN